MAAIAGVALHAAFDWMTPPHLSLWHRWDPWAVGLLGLAAAWPVLAWLVSSEIGAKSGAGVGLARFVLAALVI